MHPTHKTIVKMVAGATILVAIFAIASIVFAYSWYRSNLQPIQNSVSTSASSSEEAILVVVESGWNTERIAKELHGLGLIRSATAFEWYVDSVGARSTLQAGTYRFSKTESTQHIVQSLIDGTVETSLVTIIPGQRLDETEQALADQLNVDLASVKEATQKKYDIALLSEIPEGQTVEGYLYPETYQITGNESAETLTKRAILQLENQISDDMRQSFASQNLSLHEAITLASIVEEESATEEERPKIAQVFLSRLEQDIPLGSDVTFRYAAAVTGQPVTINIDSPYNTRVYAGLPPGPVSNFSISSLIAVAFPAKTDYLYFVAGDDGISYFSKTLAEHERLTKLHCTELCRVPN